MRCRLPCHSVAWLVEHLHVVGSVQAAVCCSCLQGIQGGSTILSRLAPTCSCIFGADQFACAGAAGRLRWRGEWSAGGCWSPGEVPTASHSGPAAEGHLQRAGLTEGEVRHTGADCQGPGGDHQEVSACQGDTRLHWAQAGAVPVCWFAGHRPAACMVLAALPWELQFHA